jgi:hypothetical protein
MVIYTNPVMPQSGTYEYSEIGGTYSSVRARNCNGNVITTYSGKGYLADPRTSSGASYFKNVISHYVNYVISSNPGSTHPYDLVFVDNAGQLYGTSSQPCNFSPSTWGAAFDTDLQATGQPIILNTLSTSIANMSNQVSWLSASNVTGGEYEHCFTDRQWTAEETAQILALAKDKASGKAPGAGFWCYVDGTTAAGSTVIAQRKFDYASFLLTYDPNYSVFQESFTTPSTFKVYPETGFVPMNPLKTPTQISDLQTSSGAYIRQYGACYYRGSLVGSCEIAVNPTGSTVSLPNSYPHSMVISGAGILDGGSVTFGGPAISSLAANSAAILIGSSSSTSTSTPAPTATATPLSGGTTSGNSYTGSVNAVESSTKFHANFGGSCGSNYVTDSGATITGGPVKVGQTVTVRTSGTCFNSPIVATAVTVGGSTTASTTSTTSVNAPYSFTGTVNWTGSYKFHAGFGGSCGGDYVSYTSSTPISGTIAVGKVVTVKSTQSSCATTIPAASITVQ